MTTADAAPLSRLPDLIALAREDSSEKRRTLLRELTNHFFGDSARSETADGLYGEVLADLSAEMEEAVRAELAQRFAPAPDAPRGLIRKLAHDEFAVAKAVLDASPVLTDDDLLSVVRSKGQDHLRAVSNRPKVSEAVSEVIVERGDDQTLETLLRNDGARLSRTAHETAVLRAIVNPALHEATVGRKTLPPDLLNDMYFVVETRLRQRILEANAAIDPAVLEEALSKGRARVAVDDGVLPHDYEEALAHVRGLTAAGPLTPHALARLLRHHSQTAFLIALAEMAEVDYQTASRIVERRELDALAVICKAAGLDQALFLTYAVVMLNRDGDAIGRSHAYARMYADLPRDAAMRTLRFWHMRRNAAAA